MNRNSKILFWLLSIYTNIYLIHNFHKVMDERTLFRGEWMIYWVAFWYRGDLLKPPPHASSHAKDNHQTINLLHRGLNHCLLLHQLLCIVSEDTVVVKIYFLTQLDTTLLSYHGRCSHRHIKGNAVDIIIFRFRWFEHI